MKKFLFILISFIIFGSHGIATNLPDGFYRLIPAVQEDKAAYYFGWGVSNGDKPFFEKKSNAPTWLAKNSSDGLVIEVPGYNFALTAPQNENGVAIELSAMEQGQSIEDYIPNSNQFWIPESVGNNKYILRYKENPALVVTLAEGSSPGKFEMTVSEYAGDNKQIWILDCEKSLEADRQEAKQRREETKRINDNFHEYVDLGLPSKLLWATMDLGSSAPEKPGRYYKWGELKPHTSTTSYNNYEREQLMNDAGDISASKVDVARHEWKGDWRLPNLKEAQELVKNCKWEEVTINGQRCFKVIGPNGNHIILPATGYYNAFENKNVHNNDYGFHWTSTRAIYKPGVIFILGTSHNPNDPHRFVISEATFKDAMPVRPVIGKGIQDDDSFLSDKSGEARGHDYVDLGLSVKWSSNNIGSKNPWEYGESFARGETTPREKFPETNTGYDLRNIAGSKYDAATQNWGEGWRLPSKSEFNELITKCTWEFVCINGHYGYKITGPNGKSIFLPSAGIGSFHGVESREQSGAYWSSNEIVSSAGFTVSRQDDKVFEGYILEFDSDEKKIVPLKIYMGASIRPVYASTLKNNGYPSPVGHVYKSEKDGKPITLDFISDNQLKVTGVINGKTQTEIIGWEQINDVIRTSGNISMTIDKTGETIEDMANYKTIFKKVK